MPAHHHHAKHPSPRAIAVQTLQAMALSLFSNILAQCISLIRSHTPFDKAKLLQFAFFAFLNTPPNVLWQAYLEERFPAFTARPHVRHYKKATRASDFVELAEPSPLETDQGREERTEAREELKRWESGKDEWTEVVEHEHHLDYTNTATKFFLDQTIGALVNTIIFVGGMAGLRGEGWSGAVGHIRTDTLPLMLAGYKLWPLVSLLSFTVIPPEKRVIFGSLIGVGWGVFLSLAVVH